MRWQTWAYSHAEPGQHVDTVEIGEAQEGGGALSPSRWPYGTALLVVHAELKEV